MRRQLVLAGVAAGVLATVLPLTAFASHGARRAQDVSVALGTAKKNDFPAEFRIYSRQLRPAQFGKPSVLQPDATTFTFTNASGEKLPHNFTIVAASPGGSRFKSRTLQA